MKCWFNTLVSGPVIRYVDVDIFSHSIRRRWYLHHLQPAKGQWSKKRCSMFFKFHIKDVHYASQSSDYETIYFAWLSMGNFAPQGITSKITFKADFTWFLQTFTWFVPIQQPMLQWHLFYGDHHGSATHPGSSPDCPFWKWVGSWYGSYGFICFHLIGKMLVPLGWYP